jgi:hypothetical protein
MIMIIFYYYIIDQSGSALPYSKTTEITNFKSNGDNWGYHSFAKRAELEPYIRDDCLIIKSTVTIFKATRNKILNLWLNIYWLRPIGMVWRG